jgi:hypothetical protein
MKYTSLTDFLFENISSFLNVIALLFVVSFCFNVGFGILFLIMLPLGYVMGIVLAVPLLIFVFFLFAVLDICVCILASICSIKN